MRTNVNKTNPFQMPNVTTSNESNKIETYVNPVAMQKQNKIETDNVETIEFGSAGFSNNDYTDKENIYINSVNDAVVGIKGKLTSGEKGDEELYKFFMEYYQGKKLSDMFDKDGKFKLIPAAGATKEDLEKIKIINEKLEGFQVTSISYLGKKTMDNLKIEEIECTKNGYDAIVFKDTETGNYVVSSCSTDAKSFQSSLDIAAISYTIARDSGLLNLDLLEPIFNDIMGSFYPDQTDMLMEEKMKNYLNLQVEDNKKLLEKYAMKAKEEGVKLDLAGYSLGGGLQLAAYGELKVENPEVAKVVNSVNVYNPFMLVAEESSTRMTVNALVSEMFEQPLLFASKVFPFLPLISNPLNAALFFGVLSMAPVNSLDMINDDEKVHIYAAQQDYVTIFNSSVKLMKDRIIWVPASDVKENSVETIEDIYSLIIEGKGNHGFSHIDLSKFDSAGNLTEQGKFTSVNYTTNRAFVNNDADNSIYGYKPNYSELILDILNLSNWEEELRGNEYKENVKVIINYFRNNYGDYDYEELSGVITDQLCDIVEAELPNNIKAKAPDWAVQVLLDLYDRQTIYTSINNYLNSEEGKKQIIQLLKLTMARNNEPDNSKKIENIIDKITLEISKSYTYVSPYKYDDSTSTAILDAKIEELNKQIYDELTANIALYLKDIYGIDYKK